MAPPIRVSLPGYPSPSSGSLCLHLHHSVRWNASNTLAFCAYFLCPIFSFLLLLLLLLQLLCVASRSVTSRPVRRTHLSVSSACLLFVFTFVSSVDWWFCLEILFSQPPMCCIVFFYSFNAWSLFLLSVKNTLNTPSLCKIRRC